MNSYPVLLFLSLLIFQGNQNIGGVEHDIVDVTDGLELQKVFDQSNRRQIPTEATLSSAEEKDLLVSGRVAGVEDSSSNAEDGKSKSDVVSESTDYSTKVFKSVSDDVQSGKLSNNKERLTPENDRGSRNLHDIRLNRNYELKGRLNIDSDGLADQNQATRDRVAKVDKIKLAEPAKVGEAAQLESLNAGTPFTAVPASNSSSMPPQPYILKVKNTPARAELDDIYFLFIVIGCSVAGIAGLALAGYCWYKLHTTAKAVSEAEYSSYGATKQGGQVSQGDHKLDYSAEIYHYQQTKSQLSALEKASGVKGGIKGETLDDDDNSDEGDDEDYTVYECHGLAPTGDMTVVNPLFSDQEVVGSDQDGNGDKSGASGQGSPVVPRHTFTES
ncbi:unnamed protein product [Pocillopora meandrina]|uniref:Neural proliferation differentiation and control protein 1 n=1 Tax=Pocillopora meandrina TaxID=46732 RepID=A0AAU9VR12_9CNID|nr:unnamed protein product [Pocillopora meandrina]